MDNNILLPFPEEVIVEILLRLPVKSILKCKTLSKHYYSLIRTQFFIRRHLTLQRLNNKLNHHSIVSPIVDSVRLFHRTRAHFEVLELKFPTPSVRETVYGPVEGLYFVIDRLSERSSVWNPSTREQLLIPRIPQTIENPEENAIVKRVSQECFIDIRQCHGCGFGYDDTTNNYKVVLIYRFSDLRDYGYDMINSKSFYVFSVSKGKWRNTEECFDVDPCRFKSYAGVFFRGSCHWIYVLTHSFEDSGYKILSFDMSTESIKFIPFPLIGPLHIEFECMSIVTINGCLGLVDAKDTDILQSLYTSFDVWLMLEYSDAESWTFLYRVSLAPEVKGWFLGIVRDWFYVREEDGCLVSYDCDSMDEERYGILDSKACSLVPYEESLVRIRQ